MGAGLRDDARGDAAGDAEGPRVLAACKAARIAFLNAVSEDNVEETIREGVMIRTGGEAAANKGRKFSKRAMPY